MIGGLVAGLAYEGTGRDFKIYGLRSFLCWGVAMVGRSWQLKRSPHRTRNRSIRIAAFVALSVAAALAAAAFAQPPRRSNSSRRSPKGTKPEPAKSKPTPQQNLQQLQARAWAALYTGKLAEAAKLAAPLLKARLESAQLEAKHFRARWYWASGTKKSRATAKKAWADLRRAGESDANAIRLKTGQALQLAAANNPTSTARAIALLKTVTPGEVSDTCIAEAGIELARLHMARGQWNEAAAALKAAEDDLNFRPKRYVPGGGGRQALPKVVTQPFLDEINRVRRQLDLAKDAGRGLFEKGEKLRNAGKFAEAIRTFHQLIKKFPSDRYAARANLHIGYCYAAMGSHRTALAHWRKFIKAARAGPWRGQAYASLIDLYLGQFLDITNAKKYAGLAAEAMPAGLGDKKLDCDTSWKAAAFGIHFQSGIVAYIGGDTSFAASHFDKALKAGGRGAASRVKRLLAFARAGRPLIPEKVGPRAAADPVSVALSVGTIYNICGDYGRAAGPFDRVAKRERCRPTTVQTSYALFGRGVAYEGTNTPKMARVYYEGSLRRYPPGEWHDETLYRAAMIIQRGAPKPTPQSPATPVAGKKTAPKRPPAPPKPDPRQVAAYLEARKAELAHWRMLIKRFPESPFAEPATYYAGMIFAAAGRWPDAAKQLTDFTAAYPNCPKAGPAHIQIIDISLERLFDLAAARKSATAATIWAGKYKPVATKDTKVAKNAAKLPGLRDILLAGWNRPPSKDQLKSTKYNIYLRAGLVAYLDQNFPLATKMFREGDKFDSSDRKKGGAQTAMTRMVEVIRGKMKKLTPKEAIDLLKDDRQKVGVLLADLYLFTFEPKKAQGLYERLVLGEHPLPNPGTSIKGYLLLRLGQALEFQGKHDEAMVLLKQLADPRYAKSPWAADGVFRVATWSYNRKQDQTEAMPYWKRVFTQFPKHKEAERALFYYGLVADHSKDYPTAISAYKEYLKRYADSRWTERVRMKLLPDVERKYKESKQ